MNSGLNNGVNPTVIKEATELVKHYKLLQRMMERIFNDVDYENMFTMSSVH